ncbi:unnamed protein product [Prorocentrum cordatum]|uniref:RanBP2-type domain-containing protein n=1 Tax=Prorocentrum cordatum TaxID=2364126 RepID=A0ABN9T8E3_9DINO|nr:unnamed protein product [Polarella glacialis]
MASHGRNGPEGAGVMLRGPKLPLWLCSCGCASNWASRLRCRECDRRCSTKVEDAARKAHEEAFKGGPKPGSHPQPRGVWARQKLAPWEHDKLQRQDSELAALRQQVEALKADSAKAKLTALSDLKEELQKLGGGEQASSCVKAVEAKYSEPPKPKSLPALEGQRRKLEGQLQKALGKVAELENQRAKLDLRIGVLGDGLRGLAKVLEQFKATAVENQAVLHGLIQLQDVVKKEQARVTSSGASASATSSGHSSRGLGFDSLWLYTVDANTEKGYRDFLDWLDGLHSLGVAGPTRRPAADITFAQETRAREGGREAVQRWHRKRGFDFDLAAGLSTGEGPLSVSGGVGIGARQRLAVATIDAKFRQPHRVLRRVVNIGDGLAIDLMSVYLRDGEGMSEANADILWDVASQLRVAARPWILAGDFNVDPLQIAAWAATAGGLALHTGTATCRAGALSELDYAIISDELQHFVFSHGPVVEAPVGPHSPVLSEVRGLHADATVQQLHRTVRLPYDRAIGCTPWAPLPAWTWEEGTAPPSPRAAMQEWLRHAEGYLLPLYDLYGDEAQKFAGKADGVRLVNVSIADASRRRWAQLSSQETHAWGGLVSLLQRADLLAARGKDSQGLASLGSRLNAMRLADYDGSCGPVPRGKLGAAATSSDAALRRRLIEHARAQHQASQRSDAAAARKQWQAWAKGAATGGGKLAHRFSKPEPLAKATLVTADEDEGDALPVNGDEAVQHCLKEWPPLWRDPRRRGGLEEAASWEATEPLPHLEVDSLRYLLKRHGRWAGLGWDQLHPRQLLRLGESFLVRLLEVLASWEDAPEAYLDWLSAIVFPATADGGRRPIALTCLQIRLWSAMRGPIVREWEAKHHEAWYIGGELNTCERAGWVHQTLTALAYEKGLSTGTALGDLRKFYENISHKELLVDANSTGFPVKLLRACCVTYSGYRVITVDGACSAPSRATGTVLADCSCATGIAKLLLFRSCKKVAAFYPSVRPGSVVDDFTLQTAGTTGMVKDGRAQRGRLLGNDVHDGRWRRTAIGAQRVEDALARTRRLQIQRTADAKVATAQRGGPTAAATRGSAPTGLAPSVLHGLRVAAARGEGPFAPGASVGLRLRCFPKGIERDPAVVNAGQVVLQFGMAPWLGYPTPFALSTLLEKAKQRLVSAKRPWATCRDPVAASLLTINRLGWSIEGCRYVTTDQGLEVDLARVSPPFSKELAEGAAKRWSDRDATFRLYPHQRSELFWGSLQRLGRTKESLGWQQHQRAALHSVISGTALSQSRLYKRGMASEWECLICRSAPGTIWHRLHGCDGHAAYRKDEASPELLRHAEVARAAGGNCGETFGRCLFPSLDQVIPRRDPDGDPVRWFQRPASGYLTGLIFTDGSAVGTRWPELQRAGWSLVQCDGHGRMVAAAWGWVPLSMAPRQEARDGEDYAYHTAAFLCEGHIDFQTDCSGAHMWNAFYASFDSSRSYTVTKVLAHATAADVETDRTTWRQQAGNKLADEAATEGAKLALADDQLDFAYGLDPIARLAMVFTGKLHARMADRKQIDHASDVTLELAEHEESYEEPEASGGHAAEASWAAAGLFPSVKGGRGAWRLGEQRVPSEAWQVKFCQRLGPPAAPEVSRATGTGQPSPAPRLPRSRALQRFGVGPEQEADFLSWSARQRAARRSEGDPDVIEGESSD